MIRKMTAWLLTVLLSVSVLNFSALAEKSDNAQVNIGTYNSYNAVNSDVAAGKDSIIVAASDAKTFGAVIDSDSVGSFATLKTQGDKVDFSFDIKTEGLYTISVKYCPVAAQEKAIELDVKLDNVQPFAELADIKLVRWWENDGEKRIADNGDEIAPHQKESFIVSSCSLRDSVGLSNEPFAFKLASGGHTVSFELKNEAVKIYDITVEGISKPLSYEQMLATWEKKGAKKAKSEPVIIEGEDALYKSSKSIVAKSDNSNAGLSPANASKNLLNFIGSNNWSSVGDTVTWKIKVDEPGLYALGFHYRQNYVLDGLSYRRLEIDGTIPFAEASQIGFAYNTNWENTVFSDEKGSPYMFYLDSGEHMLTLAVTMGPLAQLNEQLEGIVLKLGNIYRNITMVVGETADANRDYNLFGQISGLEEDLTYCSKNLKNIAEEICELSDIRSSSATVVLQNMANVIDRMLKNPYRATDYKSDYYNNYCSIGSILYEMRKAALDIDTITLSGDAASVKKFPSASNLFSLLRDL